MIILLEEGKRYLPYFEAEIGEKLVSGVENTPYGEVSYARNHEVIWISNLGTCYMGIAWMMDQYRPDCLCMVSKVGGVNKLLSVGDILLVTDYIDNTTCRPKSYVERKDPNIKIRYTMNRPFCDTWRESAKQYFKDHKSEFAGNIMDSGVYVCTDGPGFESSAEIDIFRSWGADMVGHWISPFVYYARELNVCFLSIAIVSNVFHKKDRDMENDEVTNQMFGKVFAAAVNTRPAKPCNCQSKNILEFEKYEES